MTVKQVVTIAEELVNKMKIAPNTIGTHSGKFHCDETLAVFMLKLLPKFKNHRILRTRDVQLLDQCDIIVDVGAVYDPAKKRFDHHQATFNETFSSIRPEFGDKFSNIRLSSAGLVYVHYGEEIIEEVLKSYGTKLTENQMKSVFSKIYSSFVQEIDAIDNGVLQFEGGEPKYRINSCISNRIKNFNPDWMDEESPQEIDEMFEEAVKYVGAEFLDKIKYFATSWLPAYKIVEAAYQNRFNIHESGFIIELERFCPWQEHLREMEINNDEIKFVLFNGGSKKDADYRVQAVPVKQGSFICRKFLNKKWFGLRDEALEKVSGIKGTIFCHANGFIGGNQTRKGALEMAVKSLVDDE